jgi:hypothetical protein
MKPLSILGLGLAIVLMSTSTSIPEEVKSPRKLGTVEGESADKKHDSEIEILKRTQNTTQKKITGTSTIKAGATPPARTRAPPPPPPPPPIRKLQ